MKHLHAEAEKLRFAADFVQRSQPVVDIRNRVLQSLCHDRSGELLKLENELRVRGTLLFVEVFRKTKEQKIEQEIKDRFFDCGIATFRRRHRALDHRAIFLAHWFPWFEISSIDGETGDRFAHRARQSFQGVVAKPTVLLRQPINHVAENVDFVGQRNAHDQSLLRVNEMAEMERVTDESLENFGDGAFRVVIDQHARDLIGEIVAGGAVDWPVLRQLFVAGQNFFDDQINGASILWQGYAQSLGAA